jgi:hypothetical protein
MPLPFFSLKGTSITPPSVSRSNKPICYAPPSAISSIGFNAPSLKDIATGKFQQKTVVKKISCKKRTLDPSDASDEHAREKVLKATSPAENAFQVPIILFRTCAQIHIIRTNSLFLQVLLGENPTPPIETVQDQPIESSVGIGTLPLVILNPQPDLAKNVTSQPESAETTQG